MPWREAVTSNERFAMLLFLAMKRYLRQAVNGPDGNPVQVFFPRLVEENLRIIHDLALYWWMHMTLEDYAREYWAGYADILAKYIHEGFTASLPRERTPRCWRWSSARLLGPTSWSRCARP